MPTKSQRPAPSLGARLSMAWSALTKREAPSPPRDWFERVFMQMGEAKSGQTVTVETALKATAVLACARVIAEGCAQVPVYVKTIARDGQTWTEDERHPLALFLRAPNAWQTGYEFRETLIMHAAVAGGGFAWINRAAQNRAGIEAVPILPQRVTISQREDYSILYKVRTAAGSEIEIPAGDMLHLPGPSWDGARGLAPVQLAREAIGLSLATEESHARMHKNGVRLSGILTTPAALGPDAADRLREDWDKAFSGTANSFGTPVLEHGLEFKPMGMTGVDAQHIETRRYQIEEICRAFRVFPQMVMQADKTTTFASAEQFFLAHITHTLGPWIERLSQRLERALITPRADARTWLHFDLSGLAPGDAKTRSSFYSVMVNAGVMTPNEARLKEGLNPLPGGDTLRAPVNLAPIEPPTDSQDSNEKDAA